jgi:hypothetical protein
VTSRETSPESTPESAARHGDSAPASTEGDSRTPEERLLARRKLGKAYLEDVRTLIAERDVLRATVDAMVEERDDLRSRLRTLEAEASHRPERSPRSFGSIFTRRHDEQDG